MPDSLAEWMRAKGLRRSVRAGATLAHQGDRSDSVLLVEQGRVFLERSEVDGNLLPISVCGRGSVVGLTAAILDTPHTVSAMARADGEVVTVAAALLRELTTSADHGPLVARALASEARILADRCAALQSHKVRDRVLGVLTEMSRDAQREGGYPLALALPMQELAVLVGADVAHVCRVMRALRDDGLVDYGKGRLRIRRRLTRDIDRLDAS
jgi:CRP-like cAMP-binding protein